MQIEGLERLQVWSSGGGTQSTAIAVLILQGKLPKPDYAFIADTGRETQETWDYLEAYTKPALAQIGLTIERLIPDEFPSLYSNANELLIPAFLKASERGPQAKNSNFCSSHWKRDFIKSTAFKRGLLPAMNWLGISRDEMRRLRAPRAKNWLLRYPLVFDCPMTRAECARLVQDFGWPSPPKSSCYFCPNRSDRQWAHLRDNRPSEYYEAIRLDIEIRKHDPDAYLHESRIPLADVDLSTNDQQGQLALCDSGECFV